MLVLMAAFEKSDGTFARQLAFAGSDAATTQLCEKIVGWIGSWLGGLVPLEGPDAHAFGGLAFGQGDGKASRKKVQPLIAEFLQAVVKSADGVG